MRRAATRNRQGGWWFRAQPAGPIAGTLFLLMAAVGAGAQVYVHECTYSENFAAASGANLWLESVEGELYFGLVVADSINHFGRLDLDCLDDWLLDDSFGFNGLAPQSAVPAIAFSYDNSTVRLAFSGDEIRHVNRSDGSLIEAIGLTSGPYSLGMFADDVEHTGFHVLRSDNMRTFLENNSVLWTQPGLTGAHGSAYDLYGHTSMFAWRGDGLHGFYQLSNFDGQVLTLGSTPSGKDLSGTIRPHDGNTVSFCDISNVGASRVHAFRKTDMDYLGTRQATTTHFIASKGGAHCVVDGAGNPWVCGKDEETNRPAAFRLAPGDNNIVRRAIDTSTSSFTGAFVVACAFDYAGGLWVASYRDTTGDLRVSRLAGTDVVAPPMFWERPPELPGFPPIVPDAGSPFDGIIGLVAQSMNFELGVVKFLFGMLLVALVGGVAFRLGMDAFFAMIGLALTAGLAVIVGWFPIWVPIIFLLLAVAFWRREREN
jgi:hypothetical protein